MSESGQQQQQQDNIARLRISSLARNQKLGEQTDLWTNRVRTNGQTCTKWTNKQTKNGRTNRLIKDEQNW